MIPDPLGPPVPNEKPILHIPQKNSPSTYLTVLAGKDETGLTVANSAIFSNANISRLTLGYDTATTETITVENYEPGNRINVIRGTPSYEWAIGTKIARVLNSEDVEEIHTYLYDLNEDVTTLNEYLSNMYAEYTDITQPHMVLMSNLFQRKQIFRGAYLGNTITTDQNNAIYSGTFSNLYIGDYWTIGGYNFRIVDFNYWNNSINHVVIVPDNILCFRLMDTGLNVPYSQTSMRSFLSTTWLPILQTYFGNRVGQYDEILVSSNNEYNIVTAKVEIMSESQVYGQGIFRYFKEPTHSINQFSLFKIAPSYIKEISNQSYWLRDQAGDNNGRYCCVTGQAAYYDTGGNPLGVRACFPIYGIGGGSS